MKTPDDTRSLPAETLAGQASRNLRADDAEFDDYEYQEPYCYRCDNSGWIVTCCDDLCQSGEPGMSCIHGDGDKLCPDCKGRNAF